MKSDKKRLLTTILCIVVFIFLWLQASVWLDPDFGWHFKMGQLISQSGIPKTDPFSYTMPSFPFVDHEWLINFFIYHLYSAVGYQGLAVTFSAVTLLTLLIMFPKKYWKYSLAPFLLAASILIQFGGVRTQVVTWFFLAVLMKLFIDRDLWRRFRFLLPAIMCFWANLHGGFFVGVVALILYGLIKSWDERKVDLVDWVVIVVSVAATLINPYGLRLWGEVESQITDSNLHSAIAEWTPGIFYLDLALLTLVGLTIALLIIRFRQKNYRPHLSIIFYFGFLLASMSARRHIPLWTVIAAPLLAVMLTDFSLWLKKDRFGSEAFRKCYRFLTIGLIGLFLIEGGLAIYHDQSLSESRFYPQNAVKFLQKQNIQGQIFSSYNWGGYLVWKLPEKKDFVDGRMPSWRRDSAPPGESKWAFKDYDKVVYGSDDPTQIFQKYHITTVLWPTEPPNVTSPVQKWYTWLVENLFSPKPGIPLTTRLEKTGWKVIYQDKIATVYQKNS